MKNKFEMKAPRLSTMMGKMVYRSMANPWTNDNGEVSTKVKILLDGADEMVEVKVPGVLKEEDYTKYQEIDFENAIATFRAEGKPGFNNGAPQGVLSLTLTADKIINKQKNA